jgi:hypothetical protein
VTRLRVLLPPVEWLGKYHTAWLRSDLVAGVTLAAYAVPVALAYATLAGLPPQVGVYGYILGGLGYALLGSSRHLAIGPTSAISLMVATSVGAMAGGDAARYAEIASLAAFAIAVLCLIAWALRLSALVKLISDSILVGFKAGAGITIAVTQLPAFFGVAGGGHNVIERLVTLAGQSPGLSIPTVTVGMIALALLVGGGRFLPGRPVALGVVVLSIAAAGAIGLSAHGVKVTGAIPAGLPELGLPSLRLYEVEGIFPLAAGCLLLAYIEGVSAARSYAEKHGYALNPRQEFLTGHRPPIGDADRVLATVLFTDIVHSTRRAAELGDRRWRGVLDALEARAAAEVARFRGRVVKQTGDGMLATFDGPARAIRCARAVVDAARALDLEVRAGLHVGEIELVSALLRSGKVLADTVEPVRRQPFESHVVGIVVGNHLVIGGGYVT